jgi:hypothetical protein
MKLRQWLTSRSISRNSELMRMDTTLAVSRRGGVRGDSMNWWRGQCEEGENKKGKRQGVKE